MASWEYFIYSKSGKYSPEDIAKSLIKKGYEESITCKAVTKQDVIVDKFEFLGSEFEANINISEGTEGLMFSIGAGDEEAVKKLFNVFQRRDIDVVMTAKLSVLDYKSYFEDAPLEVDGKTFFSELKPEFEVQQLTDSLELLPEIEQSNTKSDLYNFNFGTEKTLYVTEIENALSKLSGEEILKNLSDNQMQMLTEYNEFALDTNRKVDDRLLNLEAKAMQYLNKQEQMKIIQEFNPAQDNIHTWIRSSEEILTFEEALKDTAYEGWKKDGFDESYSAADAMSALETGRIAVYSSHPIKQGVFVTPSAMEARSYSGDGKIYSKEVLIDEVAWVDPTQGQYANVQEFRKTSNNIPFSNNRSNNAYDGFSKGGQALDAERAASLQKNVDIDIKTYGEVQSTTLRYIEMYGFECVDGTVQKMQEQQSVSANSIDYSVTKPEAELKQQITPFKIDITQKPITKDEFEQLTSEIKNIAQTYQADPSLISDYMAFKAQFYDYSPNNTLLIHLQNPHATFVASFTKWKEMGYSIKKGEHHIKISRPIEVSKFPRDVNGKTVWTDVKYATSDEKARIASGDLEIQKTTKFIPHQVFDISQTTCPPEDYPKIFSRGYESIEQAQLYECIKEYAKDCGFTVTEENMSSIALHGYYDKADDSIHINSTLNDSKKLETMAHELAHGVLHKTSTQPTEVKEFEAESFGTMLKRKLGFPVSEESKRYIKNYFSESKFVTKGKFNMDETLSRLSKAFKHTSTGIDKKIEEMGYGSSREQGRSLSQAKAQAVDPVKISSNFTQAL